MDFKDKRLNNRYKEIIKELKNNSKATFPNITKKWSWLKGLYRFFKNPKVRRKNLIRKHIKETVKRCMKEEVVLAIQDTTSISYTSAEKKSGLGYIDDTEKKKGFLVHTVMGVSGESGEPLGILHEEVIVRNKRYPREESYFERIKRKRERVRNG